MLYCLRKLVCLETYLRDFQFKVLNYITCTNILLKKMDIVESEAWFKRRILHAPNQILILVDSN